MITWDQKPEALILQTLTHMHNLTQGGLLHVHKVKRLLKCFARFWFKLVNVKLHGLAFNVQIWEKFTQSQGPFLLMGCVTDRSTIQLLRLDTGKIPEFIRLGIQDLPAWIKACVHQVRCPASGSGQQLILQRKVQLPSPCSKAPNCLFNTVGSRGKEGASPIDLRGSDYSWGSQPFFCRAPSFEMDSGEMSCLFPWSPCTVLWHSYQSLSPLWAGVFFPSSSFSFLQLIVIRLIKGNTRSSNCQS